MQTFTIVWQLLQPSIGRIKLYNGGRLWWSSFVCAHLKNIHVLSILIHRMMLGEMKMIFSRWFHGTADFDEVKALRTAVFVEEEGLKCEEEFTSDDDMAMHVVVYKEGIPVGTGRLWFDGKSFRIGKVCVLKEHRGGKIGDMIVRLLLDRALNVNAPSLRVNARVSLSDSLSKFGFEKVGEVFTENNKKVIEMSVLGKDVLFPSACGCK